MFCPRQTIVLQCDHFQSMHMHEGAVMPRCLPLIFLTHRFYGVQQLQEAVSPSLLICIGMRAPTIAMHLQSVCLLVMTGISNSHVVAWTEAGLGRFKNQDEAK